MGPLPVPASDCSISMNSAELIFGSDNALILAAFGRVLPAPLPPFGDAVVGDAGDLLLLLGDPSALLEPNCE